MNKCKECQDTIAYIGHGQTKNCPLRIAGNNALSRLSEFASRIIKRRRWIAYANPDYLKQLMLPSHGNNENYEAESSGEKIVSSKEKDAFQ